jgi:hypothetical protein
MMRCRPFVALTVAVAFAGCGSDKAASPLTPSQTAAITSVAVTFAGGHSTTLKPGETLRLLASATLTTGPTVDCTNDAVWSIPNNAILRLTGRQPGEVQALIGGDVTISATCGPATGTVNATVLAVTGLVVAFTPGHAPSLTIGERTQLTASATLSDGSTLGCTTFAIWSSSNPGVAPTSSPAGYVVGGAAGVATIDAVCAGVRGMLGVSVGAGIRITGLEDFPYFVLLNSNTNVRAFRVDSAGSVIRECSADAAWTSSDSSVARISRFPASNGAAVLKDREGEATLTATCDGESGQVRVRVGHYTLTGTVRSSSGAPIAGAYAVNGYSNAQGGYAVDRTSEPNGLIFAGVGFESRRLELDWNRQPSMTLDVTLTPLAGLFRQGEGSLCTVLSGGHEAECAAASAVMQDVIDFTVPRTGLLRLAGYWRRPSTLGGGLLVNLTCNGVRDPRLPLVVTSAEGGGFTVPADTSCQYRLTIQNTTNVTALPYQFSLSID